MTYNKYLNHIPFSTAPVFGFIASILLDYSISWQIGVLIIAVLLLVLRLGKSQFLFVVTLLVFGVLGLCSSSKSKQSQAILSIDEKLNHATIVVDRVISRSNNRISFFGKIESCEGVKGLINYYFSDSMTLLEGDTLNLRALKIKKVETNNEGFANYLKRNAIVFQSNISHYNIQISIQSDSWKANVKRKVLSKCDRLQLTTSAKGFVMALLVGDKTFLNRDFRTSWQELGLAHVLALSGLHVGVLFMIILTFLIWVPNRFVNQKRLLVILALWIFYFSIDTSPSVLRAVIMFSWYMVSLILERRYSLLSSLFFACLVSLIINPSDIYELGFQFSFLAVLGIGLFFPLLQSLVKTKRKVVKYFFDLTWLSFSAQSLLIPVSLYTFKELPLLFWLFNLIILPFIYCIMLIGIVVLLLPLEWSEVLRVGFLINWVTNLLTSVSAMIARYNLILVFEDIRLEYFILYYAFLGSILIYHRTKKSLWLIIAIGLLLMSIVFLT